MANALYDKAREGFLNGDIDWTNDTIKVVLLDVEVENYEYAADLPGDQYLSDVPAQARIATATLTNKSATAGVADADKVRGWDSRLFKLA